MSPQQLSNRLDELTVAEHRLVAQWPGQHSALSALMVGARSIGEGQRAAQSRQTCRRLLSMYNGGAEWTAALDKLA
jgi:hypothetical protein